MDRGNRYTSAPSQDHDSHAGDVALVNIQGQGDEFNAQGERIITSDARYDAQGNYIDAQGAKKEDMKSLLSPSEPPRAEEKPPPNMVFFIIVAWVTFLGEMSRGLVIPVLWPYLQLLEGTIEFLGMVSAAFSFARFFAAPFFGWWSNKRSHKEVMLMCLTFLILGNTLYALYPPPWLLLISRSIIGLGAGTLGQSRGYVSQVTTKEQRTQFMAYLTVSQFAGFAVTPGVSVLLSFIDFDLFGVERLDVDKYSSAGYLMASLSLITLFIVYFVFKDPPPIPKKEAEVDLKKPPKEPLSIRLKSFMRSIPIFFQQPAATKIILFSWLIFATRTAVAIVETASAEIAQKTFDWDSTTLSYFLCGLGVVGTIILIMLPRIIKKMGTSGEGLLLCLGVFSLAFGMGLMMPWHSRVVDEYTFIVGLGFTWSLGSALCQTLIVTFLSRILDSDSQGAVMGWLASLGSIARIVGGLWAGFALGTGAGPYLALGIPSGLMLMCLIGVSVIVAQTYRESVNTKL